MADGGAWERLRSERLLETPYFALRSDRLRLPDGEIKDPYYVVERPDAAIIFPLTTEGEVVLVRQYRPPLQRMELGLPAGLVEEGEKPEAAASWSKRPGTRGTNGSLWDLWPAPRASRTTGRTSSSPAASRRHPRRA